MCCYCFTYFIQLCSVSQPTNGDNIVPFFDGFEVPTPVSVVLCCRTVLGHLLTEVICLLLPGHCRHREDNENAPEACGNLQAKNDQSSRVSLG